LPEPSLFFLTFVSLYSFFLCRSFFRFSVCCAVDLFGRLFVFLFFGIVWFLSHVHFVFTFSQLVVQSFFLLSYVPAIETFLEPRASLLLYLLGPHLYLTQKSCMYLKAM